MKINVLGKAKPIAAPSTIEGNVLAGKPTLFKFDLLKRSALSVGLSTKRPAVLELFNGLGKRISQAPRIRTSNAAIRLSEATGTYYLKLSVRQGRTKFRLSLDSVDLENAPVTSAAPVSPASPPGTSPIAPAQPPSPPVVTPVSLPSDPNTVIYAANTPRDAQPQQTPTFAPIGTNPASQYALGIINEYRRLSGLQPLSLNIKLSYAAEAHSQDMAINNYVGKTGSLGSSIASRVAAAGYAAAQSGEIAYVGQVTAMNAFTDWTNDPEARANLLNPVFKDVGISTFRLGSTNAWTIDFANPMR
ncbi:MAG TPA: CAP domain-containing protein [Trichocoleus sp.]|jgi:uncharacterized protein YkwD